MSEHDFREVGWMSGKAARWNQVDHAVLRELLTSHYLPRIPVVSTPDPSEDEWMLDASDVQDPDDVAHVQVARPNLSPRGLLPRP